MKVATTQLRGARLADDKAIVPPSMDGAESHEVTISMLEPNPRLLEDESESSEESESGSGAESESEEEEEEVESGSGSGSGSESEEEEEVESGSGSGSESEEEEESSSGSGSGSQEVVEGGSGSGSESEEESEFNESEEDPSVIEIKKDFVSEKTPISPVSDSSEEESTEETPVVDIKAGIDALSSGNDGWDDKGSSSTTIVLILGIGIFAFLLMWKRRGGSSQRNTRKAGYQQLGRGGL